MVREWGMSEKIGPMAWGSQGQVFLGEDLMHTRDYSEHTSQIIDDEVEQILRNEEQRALDVLARHRGGLDAVARALLDEETIDGETVGRLVDTAYGRPVHAAGVKTVPPIFVASQHGPSGSDNVDGPPADATPGTDGAVQAGPAPVPSAETTTGPVEPVQPAGSANNASPEGSVTPEAGPAAPGPGNGSAPQAGGWPQPQAPWPGKQAPWPPPPPPASR
jgi:hypothetical protein